MNSKPRLLDLFCGAGGAAVGYARAGFDVMGVDIKPQPRYPFEFVQMDALEFLNGGWFWERRMFGDPAYGPFDAIHAGPPCQRWANGVSEPEAWPDFITPIRPWLDEIGLPYVIENVPRSPLVNPMLLCGSMFTPPLDIKRHRHFETNWPLIPVLGPCRHRIWEPRFPKRASKGLRKVVSVFGRDSLAPLVREVMDMPWATRDEIAQATHPAYTEFIGNALMAHLKQTVYDSKPGGVT